MTTDSILRQCCNFAASELLSIDAWQQSTAVLNHRPTSNSVSICNALLSFFCIAFSSPSFSETDSSNIDSWQGEFEDRVKISGFARIVGGYLDTEQASFRGYENSLSFNEQSLFAVQLDATLTDSISFTTQVLAHKADTRDSGVEWAYFTYSPNRNWQARVGKQRTPFYTYSDVLDVGYAYPYIDAPVQIYSSNLFTNYEGINVSYQTGYQDLLLGVEVFWGSYDDELTTDIISFDLKVEDLKGLILNGKYDNFEARIGYYQANMDLQIPSITELVKQLQFFNFNQSAASLDFNGSVKFKHAALSYKSLTWFVELEVSDLHTEVLLVPDIESYLLTVGYQFDDFSIYANVSGSNNTIKTAVNEIPIGIDPGLDQLAFAYQSVFQQVGADDLRSYTLGVRYDLPKSMALKASLTRLNGESGQRSFFDINNPSFDRKANLYQIALEWAF